MNEYKYLRWSLFGVIAVVLLLVSYGIFLNVASSDHIKKLIDAAAVEVEAYHAEERDIHAALAGLDLSIRTPWKIDIQSESEGTVAAIHVSPGQRVQAGDPLVTLENRDLPAEIAGADADIEAARAAYINSEEQYIRYAKLVEMDAISREKFDEAIANRDAAQARLDSARARRRLIESKREKLVITAPREADVLAVYAKYGHHISPNERFMLLADITRLTAKSIVRNQQLANIMAAGSEFYLEIKPYMIAYKAFPMAKEKMRESSGKNLTRFAARLESITPPLDQAAEIREIEWRLENTEALLEPTTYRDVRLISKEHRMTLAVPITAIDNYFGAGENHLFVVGEDGKLAQRTVKTGISDGRFVEVLDGLTAGEIIARSDEVDLRDGMTVRPKITTIKKKDKAVNKLAVTK